MVTPLLRMLLPLHEHDIAHGWLNPAEVYITSDNQTFIVPPLAAPTKASPPGPTVPWDFLAPEVCTKVKRFCTVTVLRSLDLAFKQQHAFLAQCHCVCSVIKGPRTTCQCILSRRVLLRAETVGVHRVLDSLQTAALRYLNGA